MRSGRKVVEKLGLGSESGGRVFGDFGLFFLGLAFEDFFGVFGLRRMRFDLVLAFCALLCFGGAWRRFGRCGVVWRWSSALACSSGEGSCSSE